MKEKNKNTLREAISRLPAHDPSSATWEAIEHDLKPSLAERLPSYQPPVSVWNGLSEQLETEARSRVPGGLGKEQSTRTRRLPYRWLAVAASVLVLLFAGYGISSRDEGPKVTYARTQEVIPATTLPDWDEEEGSFDRILAQLETINEPGLNTMRIELEELTAAKEDVKAMLLAYGDDPTVVRQLVKIERERSDVYRRIIVLL
ncbi:hypothetical protein [Neolewinella antarctica]|uniref:Uncharacterized protein n=1 Tax=Neolewinella antarctica TaxID=442734 RepID=A0ABX0XBF2_9BACT|nr:hypothetical protein [Neolewinella antarctica]NJC26604.1 hypothetical protein [Neolewinella antarctica]